jgi:hypothetical protein
MCNINQVLKCLLNDLEFLKGLMKVVISAVKNVDLIVKCSPYNYFYPQFINS